MARWRTLVVGLGLPLGLIVYAFAIGWLAERIGAMPVWLAVLFYVFAGLIWMPVTRPLFRWTGRDRVPENWGAP